MLCLIACLSNCSILSEYNWQSFLLGNNSYVPILQASASAGQHTQILAISILLLYQFLHNNCTQKYLYTLTSSVLLQFSTDNAWVDWSLSTYYELIFIIIIHTGQFIGGKVSILPVIPVPGFKIKKFYYLCIVSAVSVPH